MDDLAPFFCWNKNCPEYGIRGGKNIHVRSLYGKNKDIRLLYCLRCGKKFSERRGTIFFDARLPQDQIVSIVKHVNEGNGMRKTGRLLDVCHVTVSRYTKLAGEHAEQLHDELVAFSPSQRRDTVRREVGVRSKEAKEL